MELLKELLENAIGAAEEYRLTNHHPAGVRIHAQYIRDIAKTLHRSRYQAASPEDETEVYAAALETLKSLQSSSHGSEPEGSLPILQVRANLEKVSGCKLRSFDGTKLDEFESFLGSFVIVVEGDASMTNILKLILLKHCLKGAAFDLVNVLRTSTKNYRPALRLLTRVYNESRCVDPELYHSMVAVPQVAACGVAEFDNIFWKLESILESISAGGVQINDDSYLRLVYSQKFPEETFRNSELSLFRMRTEIRRLVYLQELNSQFIALQPNVEKPSTDKPAADKPSVDSPSSNKPSADGSAPNKPSADKSSANKPSAGESSANKPSAEKPSANKPKSKRSMDDAAAGEPCGGIISVPQLINRTTEFVESLKISGQDSLNYAPTLFTVCAPVSFRTNGRKNTANLRILLQTLPPVSLLTEAGAKRLGINCSGQKKSLRLRGTLGNRFTATGTTFKLSLDLGNGDSDSVRVHIVGDSYASPDFILPGVHVADFKKEHPHLSHLDLPDTGAGRPVHLYLSGEYWTRYFPNFEWWQPSSDSPPVNLGWSLTPSVFGLILGGHVARDESEGVYVMSFGYDD